MAFFYFNRESPSTPSTLVFYSTNYYFHRRKKSGDSFFHPPHLPHCFRLSSIPFGHRVFFSSTICGFDVLDDIRVGKSPHTLRILVKYKGGLFSRFFTRRVGTRRSERSERMRDSVALCVSQCGVSWTLWSLSGVYYPF